MIKSSTQTFGLLDCLCLYCNRKNAKYICPQCKIPYCSLRCYQSHNLECTENFYQEQVLNGLKNKKPSKEEISKFHKILASVNEQGKDLDLECLTEEQEKRLEIIESQIDEKQENIELTQAEIQCFENDIKNGNLLKYIEEWKPWWLEENPQNPDIAEITADSWKSIYNSLPPITALCKSPSNEIVFHIANALWSFAYVWRSYNGDTEYNESDMCSLLLEISDVLSGEIHHEISSLETSVYKAIENAMIHDNEVAKRLNLAIIYDLFLIFKHKSHIVKCLLSLYEFFGLEQISQFMKGRKGNKKIQNIRKKLFFYLSFIKSKSNEKLIEIADQLLAIYNSKKAILH
ncbi:unnamed protein product [Blepharisma stoltei]|uniref:HIT-type domain-containing protein n=1 Tax=Blepharisma stoltei TaxID=1481888 RepID=A0AAU9IEM8_9CILI|nr:unnamed protein product [Blepharisma stoltei]